MIAEYFMGCTQRFRVSLLEDIRAHSEVGARYVVWEYPDGFFSALGLRDNSGVCRSIPSALGELHSGNPVPAAELEELLTWARQAAGNAATGVSQVVATALRKRFATDAEVRLIAETLTVGSFICKPHMFEVLLRLEYENLRDRA